MSSTSATIANPIWLNENRPYDEDTDFINLNARNGVEGHR